MTSSVTVFMLLLCSCVVGVACRELTREEEVALGVMPLEVSLLGADDGDGGTSGQKRSLFPDYSNQTMFEHSGNQTTFEHHGNQTTLEQSGNQTTFEQSFNQTTPTPPADICGSTSLFLGPSGSLRSPGYPGNYPSNTHCYVTISVTPGNAVEIEFEDFAFEAAGCAYDYINVFNLEPSLEPGSYVDDHNNYEVETYCGSNIPGILVSHSNNVALKMVTDGTEQMRGFLATYKEVESTKHIISCPDDHFSCTQSWNPLNPVCVDRARVCDGQADCPYDNGDEYEGCATIQTCAAGDRMPCRDGSRCFPKHKFCDGHPECRDGSDEYFGCERMCDETRNETLCGDGKRCISKDDFCDGWKFHCNDRSDEYRGCASDCGSDRWACRSGRQCIDKQGIYEYVHIMVTSVYSIQYFNHFTLS